MTHFYNYVILKGRVITAVFLSTCEESLIQQSYIEKLYVVDILC